MSPEIATVTQLVRETARNVRFIAGINLLAGIQGIAIDVVDSLHRESTGFSNGTIGSLGVAAVILVLGYDNDNTHLNLRDDRNWQPTAKSTE